MWGLTRTLSGRSHRKFILPTSEWSITIAAWCLLWAEPLLHTWSSELSPSGSLTSLCLIPVSAMEGQREYRLSVRIELGSNTTQPFAGHLTLGTQTKSSQTRVCSGAPEAWWCRPVLLNPSWDLLCMQSLGLCIFKKLPTPHCKGHVTGLQLSCLRAEVYRMLCSRDPGLDSADSGCLINVYRVNEGFLLSVHFSPYKDI